MNFAVFKATILYWLPILIRKEPGITAPDTALLTEFSLIVTIPRAEDYMALFNKFPFLSTKRTCGRVLPGVEPVENAMHMEEVGAGSLNDWTIVSRKFAVRTTGFKGVSTNSTSTIVRAPPPGSHPKPTVDLKEESTINKDCLFTFLRTNSTAR